MESTGGLAVRGPMDSRRASPSQAKDGCKGKGAGKAQSKRDPISGFVNQWGLDADSESLVRSLPQDLQDEVLTNFQPQAGTRNPNAKLATWVRSIRQEGGAPKRARLQ